MSREPEQNRDFDDPAEAPERLVHDLRSLYRREVRVPEALDRLIVSSARVRVARARARRMTLARWSAAAAAAAAVLLLVLWYGPPQRHDPVVGPAVAVRAEDINADGRVNIVDAYLLAVRVEQLSDLDAAWDINGDGKVDQEDARAIAVAVVSLKGGPQQ